MESDNQAFTFVPSILLEVAEVKENILHSESESSMMYIQLLTGSMGKEFTIDTFFGAGQWEQLL